MRNLLALLSGKLELCARLPVFELEAADEGHDDAVRTFRRLGEAERRSIENLKRCLVGKLSVTASPPSDRDRRSQ